MRPTVFALVASLALLAGCVDAGIDTIEHARRERGSGDAQESVEEGPNDVPLGPPTPLTPAPPAPTRVTPDPTPTSPPAAPNPTPLPTPPTPAPTTPTPTPVPTQPPTPWPREGSFVRAVVDGPEGRSFLNWTYVDDDWVGTCERAGLPVVAYREDSPPHWPLFNTRAVPPVGEDVEAWWVEGCEILRREVPYAGIREGDHEAAAPGFSTRWDATSGLVLWWQHEDDDGLLLGRMYATDAPSG